MRYLTLLGSCLLTLTILGCSERPQPATPPAEESASSDESAPAPDHATEAGKDSASGETNENDGGFNLGIDIGAGGVHVDTEGPDKESGVEVDVAPDGQVDVDVGKKLSGESEDSSP